MKRGGFGMGTWLVLILGGWLFWETYYLKGEEIRCEPIRPKKAVEFTIPQINMPYHIEFTTENDVRMTAELTGRDGIMLVEHIEFMAHAGTRILRFYGEWADGYKFRVIQKEAMMTHGGEMSYCIYMNDRRYLRSFANGMIKR